MRASALLDAAGHTAASLHQGTPQWPGAGTDGRGDQALPDLMVDDRWGLGYVGTWDAAREAPAPFVTPVQVTARRAPHPVVSRMEFRSIPGCAVPR